MLAIGVMLLMLLGEFAALRILGQGHDTFFLRGLTSLALIYGFLFVLAQGARLLFLTQPEPPPIERFRALEGQLKIAVLIITFGSLRIVDPGFPL